MCFNDQYHQFKYRDRLGERGIYHFPGTKQKISLWYKITYCTTNCLISLYDTETEETNIR
jgi:hypothetical protein